LKRAAELPPEEALAVVHEALARVPGSEQLLQLKDEISRRIARIKREQILADRLAEARQLIDDGFPRDAAKLLKRSQADGYSSRELDGLLEIAESAVDEDRPLGPLEQTYAQAKRPINEGAYGSATDMLQHGVPDKDEPVLRRQAEEASQKQLTTARDAATAMETAERLLQLGLFVEALDFLEGQPAGVKRLPEVDVATRRAKLLRQGEEATFHLLGRCYARLESEQAVEDLKQMLTVEMIDDEQGSREAAKAQLRNRWEEIYREKASNVITSARRFLAEDDTQSAEEMLKEALSWIDLAPPELQQQVRALHQEASGAKKWFRRTSRR
jgi:hypothetical protein